MQSTCVLSYIDLDNRGYVTAIGTTRFSNDAEDKRGRWVERFRAVFLGGPKSDEYSLIVFVPQQLELRSFGLKVAEVPTEWSQVVLEHCSTGEWRRLH